MNKQPYGSHFITFEGPDGSGKTSQLKLAAAWLKRHGVPLLITREPGGTSIGEEIRKLLHDTERTEMARETEILLYSASRAQHVAEIILPALEAGKVVLCDRFFHSTYAYQGYGRGIDVEVLRAITGMTLFAAAYMAENIRGGLQAIPRGQEEAAKAVGLNSLQTMALIIMPQALRAVIPAIVGQFISLFMDTTLAVIVGLVELLAVGRTVLSSNRDWLLLDKEIYIFIAAVFWIFTFAMSYASRQLETALGVGER